MNEDGQWIVLMGFLVCTGIIVLAIIIHQSVLVGQTTAESVLEFPKNKIQDIRAELSDLADDWDNLGGGDKINIATDLETIALHRGNAVVWYEITDEMISGTCYRKIKLHYNDGVTEFDETAYHAT